MSRPLCVLVALAAALAFSRLATAQEGAPEPAPEASPAEAAPTPRKPKPRPKSRPKAESRAESKSEAKPAAEAGPAPSDARTLPPEPVAHPATSAVTAPSATPFASPAVACDPGQAPRYQEGEAVDPKAAGLWVTRTGSVSIDNPLRPLTPDVTRVLQVVVGAKLATAYGPDLTALRRGPTPGALEGVLGGPIRWDATLGSLPETLSLVSDAGKPLAEMRFRECGEAPAVKAPAVARKPRGGTRGEARTERKGDGRSEVGSAESADARQPAPRKPAVKTPPGFNLPQGAIE